MSVGTTPSTVSIQVESTGDRLTRWAVFGVLMATAPLIFSAVQVATHDPSGAGQQAAMTAFQRSLQDANLVEQVLAKGELLLVAAAIAAGGVGELVGKGSPNKRKFKIISGGMSVMIVLICSYWFADISGAVRDGEAVDLSVVSSGSLLLFLFSVVAAGSSLVVAEV